MDFRYPLQNRDTFVINTEIPVLSFFTGAGFLDIGFKRAGFNVVWRNEANPTFVTNFEHGMFALTGRTGESKINAPQSIESLSAEEIMSQAFQKTPRPDVFGVIGGPPCPDFSAAGKNRGGEGDHGKLLKVFIDRISKIQPSFFLIENVLGLVKTTKHRLFLCDVLDTLSEKYAISIRMLNSIEFGVAQDRYRIFIIGMLRDWLGHNSDCSAVSDGNDWKIAIERIKSKVQLDKGKEAQRQLFPEGHWFPWPEDKRYLNAKTTFKWPTTSPFGGTPDKVMEIPQELMVGPLICDQNELATLANGTEGFKPHSKRFQTIAEGDIHGKSFKRLHRWRYSPTAAYGNNEVHLHPSEPRRLTVREAFRIQSVPDNYEFPSDTPLAPKFKMIGNGVPVRLAEAVGISVAFALKGKFDQQLILSQGGNEK